MQRILISIIFVISVSQSYAQPEKTQLVKGIRGEYSVILALSDVTGREALQLAREDAKRKALDKVCGLRVNIWDQMETSSAGDVFNSLSISQTEGEILEFNIIEEGYKQSEVRSSETIFYCVADVRVKKGREPDPDFSIAVNGLKSVYYSGEELLFDVKPYRDCYMKIFLLEDERVGYLLYPNEYDKDTLLKANQKWAIADSLYYSFELQKSSNRDKEINRLVFLFTKREMPFNEQITSRSEIEKWIASIPNDQKFMHFAIIEIRDK